MADVNSLIKVRLFSYLKEQLGVAEISIEAGSVETISDVMTILEERHGELVKMKPFIRFALNQQYCADSQEVKAGDEVALITPVSGG